MHVAASFAENGMVLTLGRYETDISCFDAQWFSCHQHEREVLFFGGDSILQIRTIHKIENGSWASFGLEIKAIQAIRSLANGSNITFDCGRAVSWRLRNLIRDMITSTLVRPAGAEDFDSPYVRQLLMYQIRNTPDVIVYDLGVLIEDYKFLHSVFMKNVNRGIPNIVNLCNLFPRANEVVIEMPILFEISEDFAESLIEDLSNIGRSVKVDLQWPSGSGTMIEINRAKLNKYGDRLAELGVAMSTSLRARCSTFSTPEALSVSPFASNTSHQPVDSLSMKIWDEGEFESESIQEPFSPVIKLPDDVLMFEQDIEQSPKESHQYDAFSILLFLLALASNIIVLIEWYLNGETQYFWIGFCILILAQLSNVFIFYTVHRPKSLFGFILSLLCTFWCIPLYPVLFHFASSDRSHLRKWKYLNWNVLSQDVSYSPRESRGEQILNRNLILVMQALTESLPMIIIQLSFILMNWFQNIRELATMLIFVLILVVNVFEKFSSVISFLSSKLNARSGLVWICIIIDFVGWFFVMSCAFYNELFPEFEPDLNRLAIAIWCEFIFCLLPCACCVALIMTIAFVDNIKHSACKCCILFPFCLCFVLCILPSLLLMSMASTSWLVTFLQLHGSAARSQSSKRKFFETLYHWILDGSANVVDIDSNRVIWAKNDDRKLRVCVVNKILMENATHYKDYDRRFFQFLKHEAKSKFTGITWSGMRQHNVHSNSDQYCYRNARFTRAFFVDFYAKKFVDLVNDESSTFTCDSVLQLCLLSVLTFIIGPLYVFSRAFNILVPFIISIYLFIVDGDFVFIDIHVMAAFFVCLLYAVALILWLIGFVILCRDEFYLWHILPTVSQFGLFSIRDGYSKQNMDRVFGEIHEAHYDIMAPIYEPLVKRLLLVKFGKDVADVVVVFLYSDEQQ